VMSQRLCLPWLLGSTDNIYAEDGLSYIVQPYQFLYKGPKKTTKRQ
jgi:hypothetical protein